MATITADEARARARTGFWTRTRVAGAAYIGLGVAAALVFGALAPADPIRFVLGQSANGASLRVGGAAGAIIFGLAAAAAGAGLLAGVTRRWAKLTLHGVALVGLLMSFLCWQIAAATNSDFMPVVDMLDGTLGFALPLILGGLAGLLCERSGVINVAIEGQFIVAAFAAAMFTTLATSVWVGLFAAAIGGMLIAAILAVLSIRYLVNQVVLGVILVAFGLGLTGFLYQRMMATDQERYNVPTALPVWKIPVLSKIPVIGPVLFDANILVYLTIVLVVVIEIGLFQTRWGLRVRAVGEHPTAADTLGVRVLLVRYRNVLLGGIVAGLGGSYFVLNDGIQFQKGMSAGLGFISLAALIVGRWNPIGVLLAALFFGFAQKLAFYLQVIQSPIPSQFLAMTPYIVTIVAVAGLVGRVRAPAADGQPYVKG